MRSARPTPAPRPLRSADSSGSARQVLRVRKKYGGLGVTDVRRLKQLEQERARLKQMMARKLPRQVDSINVEFSASLLSL